MNLDKIEEILENEPSFREDQVKKALFQRGVQDWSEVKTLPKKIRKRLTRANTLQIESQISESIDEKTVKATIKLKDGKLVESVLMRHQEERNTVCVSTQIGCRLGCEFCATGKMRFIRNLTKEEIIMQVYYFLRFSELENIDNVVFMGMGEPFLNYEAVNSTINTLNDENAFNIGSRKISVSTAGLPEKIKKFALDQPQVNLAVSLHAADNKTRSKLMPINKKHPLKELFSAVDYYIKKTNRKVMFEYIPFKGVNDRPEDIDNLVSLLENRLHFVNIIPYNKIKNRKSSSEPNTEEFKNKLEKRGLNVGIRESFGQDIEGACGQLALDNSSTERASKYEKGLDSKKIKRNIDQIKKIKFKNND